RLVAQRQFGFFVIHGCSRHLSKGMALPRAPRSFPRFKVITVYPRPPHSTIVPGSVLAQNLLVTRVRIASTDFLQLQKGRREEQVSDEVAPFALRIVSINGHRASPCQETVVE